jgi:hypothetical protein
MSTVKELIEELSKFDPEKKVIVSLHTSGDSPDFVYIVGWPEGDFIVFDGAEED